jgi:hypothetical protein
LNFSTAIFRTLYPHALSQNIRIVSVNDREYPGSSPFNSREMNNMLSNDPKHQATWLRELGIQMATFIAHFIKKENIPPPQRISGKDVGGVCFLAWSLGNNTLFSLLAHLALLDPSITSVLEHYVRTMVVYGRLVLFMF